MGTQYRAYTHNDLMKVSRFLSHVHSRLNRPNSWTIARFQFEIFFYQLRAGLLPGWEQNIGLWEHDNGELAAVVCRDGDFYFQLDTDQPEEELLREMFEFIEKKSAPGAVKLAVPKVMTKLEEAAQSRGYVLLPNESDNVVSIRLEKEMKVVIPEGFSLQCGEEVSDQAKAQGHIMAFNYPGTAHAEKMLQLYGGIRQAPGYCPELDLSLVNGQGEVVAFCNAFVDEVNRIGILEPVGTHADYRLRGLGQTVIYEALNRLRSLGMVKVYTGPMQPFYQRIGFEMDVEFGVWSLGEVDY
ncbi:GNAT family N-acetyltransferase [Paenibacillus sonchi]|uniref:GNAT family N-acetyltransferase n=1 Tax=Paenibacillus sonchi TaxID=373687 RepID=UPI001E592F52|nr:GNAT family N-acetyltransferase [Paenibacillus sonchi]MCE3200145.1 GNAT family N-acetyltransferase [Paenibacillus sonchi]